MARPRSLATAVPGQTDLPPAKSVDGAHQFDLGALATGRVPGLDANPGNW